MLAIYYLILNHESKLTPSLSSEQSMYREPYLELFISQTNSDHVLSEHLLLVVEEIVEKRYNPKDSSCM